MVERVPRLTPSRITLLSCLALEAQHGDVATAFFAKRLAAELTRADPDLSEYWAAPPPAMNGNGAVTTRCPSPSLVSRQFRLTRSKRRKPALKIANGF